MILLIDNYDSFVHNLARYFRRLGQETLVLRNDAVSLQNIAELNPQAIVLSPGPGTPQNAGICPELVRQYGSEVPILGVCLGHQVIATAFGAIVSRAREPMHGRTSVVSHQASPLFEQIPSPYTVCRYHSLVVDPITLPDELAVTAQSEDSTVMAIEHIRHPLVGVQFHPEATLTGFGFRLLANFLDIAGISINNCSILEKLAESEFRFGEQKSVSLPVVPVTF